MKKSNAKTSKLSFDCISNILLLIAVQLIFSSSLYSQAKKEAYKFTLSGFIEVIKISSDEPGSSNEIYGNASVYLCDRYGSKVEVPLVNIRKENPREMKVGTRSTYKSKTLSLSAREFESSWVSISTNLYEEDTFSDSKFFSYQKCNRATKPLGSTSLRHNHVIVTTPAGDKIKIYWLIEKIYITYSSPAKPKPRATPPPAPRTVTAAPPPAPVDVNAQDASGNTKLHLAVQNSNRYETDRLVAKGIDINMKNNSGKTALHEAVSKKNPELTQALLSSSANINARTGLGKTPLHLAVESNDKEMVTLLLRNSPDASAADNAGKRPLDMAIESNNVSMVKLLAPKANVSQSSAAMNKAITARNNEIVSVLLRNGADPTVALDMSQKANNIELFGQIINDHNAKATNAMFNDAVSNRRFEVAELILDSGVDKDQALDFAIQKNEKNMVRAAMGVGANPQKVMDYAITGRDVSLATEAVDKGADPTNGLNQAITANNMPMIDMLLTKGADANVGMETAVAKNNATVTRKLLDKGADKNRYMSTAATNGSDQIVEAMLLHGADPNLGIGPAIQNDKISTAKLLLAADGADGNPALVYAVEKGNMNLVQASFNASIPADPNRGMSKAVNNQRAEILEVLLENGADGTKPMYMETASQQNNKTMVTSLLRYGAPADPGMENAINNNNEEIVSMLLSDELGNRKADGSKPQYIATATNNTNTPMVKLLLKEGADPNAGIANAVNKNSTEITSLLIKSGADGSGSELMNTASEHGNASLVQVLLDAGGDPNAGLKTAIQNSNSQITAMLLKAGADASPAHYMVTASGNNSTEVVKLLLDQNADPNPGMMPAIKGNFPNIASQLINAGADGNVQGYLAEAAVHNNTSLTGILIDAGSNPEEALNPAVQSNADQVVKQIVGKGVDVTSPQLLTDAVYKNYLATAKELMVAGSDPNIPVKASTGHGLLHHATNRTNLPMMKLLISFEIDVDAQVTGSENTALHIIAPMGKKYVNHVKTLLQADADPNITNAQNKTVLKVAKSMKVKKAIKKAGGKKKVK